MIESGGFKGGGRWGAGHWFTNNELWLGNNLFFEFLLFQPSLTGELMSSDWATICFEFLLFNLASLVKFVFMSSSAKLLKRFSAVPNGIYQQYVYKKISSGGWEMFDPFA